MNQLIFWFWIRYCHPYHWRSWWLFMQMSMRWRRASTVGSRNNSPGSGNKKGMYVKRKVQLFYARRAQSRVVHSKRAQLQPNLISNLVFGNSNRRASPHKPDSQRAGTIQIQWQIVRGKIQWQNLQSPKITRPGTPCLSFSYSQPLSGGPQISISRAAPQ